MASTRAPSRHRLVLAAITLPFLTAASTCSSNSTNPDSPTTSFTTSSGWTCATGINCQDVFDFQLAAAQPITITANNISSGSAAEVALYGPGVALGGVDLLTGDTNELACHFTSNCSTDTTGQQVQNFTAVSAGRYRLAVTRNWGQSCNATGTYTLSVTSTQTFTPLGQTVDDQASLATGQSCPAP